MTHFSLGEPWGCAAGMPENLAEAYAGFDIDAARGELFHAGSELSDLIGHPTTPLAEVLPSWLPKSSAAAS
jgi:NAD(P)H dehydrogenase (quinone)